MFFIIIFAFKVYLIFFFCAFFCNFILIHCFFLFVPIILLYPAYLVEHRWMPGMNEFISRLLKPLHKRPEHPPFKQRVNSDGATIAELKGARNFMYKYCLCDKNTKWYYFSEDCGGILADVLYNAPRRFWAHWYSYFQTQKNLVIFRLIAFVLFLCYYYYFWQICYYYCYLFLLYIPLTIWLRPFNFDSFKYEETYNKAMAYWLLYTDIEDDRGWCSPLQYIYGCYAHFERQEITNIPVYINYNGQRLPYQKRLIASRSALSYLTCSWSWWFRFFIYFKLNRGYHREWWKEIQKRNISL